MNLQTPFAATETPGTHAKPLPLFDIPLPASDRDSHSFLNPSAYEGLYAFHKYWGKKPCEPLRFLVEALTDEGDLVMDPFLGAGAIAREAAILRRRFIGGDINPFSIKLASFLTSPCSKEQYRKALDVLESSVKNAIDDSYGSDEHASTSHILWRDGNLLQVWERATGKRNRLERLPNHEDLQRSQAFTEYTGIGTRELRMFDNSRINSKTSITWKDLFTGRALRNISLLREAISQAEPSVRLALELTLTASIGQMSKMVFAISGRGKTTGKQTGKIEVGSWVIGYWRPETHFEINVWNCFSSKASKLSKGLTGLATLMPGVEIREADAQSLMLSLEENSLDLLITDPPHGDRIPYLELSELWNATLGLEPDYPSEIVVSNAKTRRKTTEEYNLRMTSFLADTANKLKPGGSIALFFNSRHDQEWTFIRDTCTSVDLIFSGAFKMQYSASSVVQDNREGSMKQDFILIFSKGMMRSERYERLKAVPGWVEATPYLEEVV